MTTFAGKNIVITGAAAGIGRCLAEKFLELDARVWVTDINETALADFAQAARKRGQRLEAQPGDVTEPGALDKLAATVGDAGGISVWVNNAGIGGLGAFHEQSAAQFERVLAINLIAVVNGTRAALRPMEAAGTGTIVNMASVAGHVAPPFMTAYSASKHGVVGFTRALRAELSMNHSPVKLVMVSPGFVDTAIIAKGEKIGFPPWLEWALSTPQKVVEEILNGLRRGHEEIYPTFNGRMMLRAHRLFPKTTVRSSKVLLAKSLKDYVLNRFRL